MSSYNLKIFNQKNYPVRMFNGKKYRTIKFEPGSEPIDPPIITPQPIVVKSYTWQDADQTLFGVSPQSGLLSSSNTLTAYDEPPRFFRVWQNIPASTFNRLQMRVNRYGQQWVTLLGLSNGTPTVLIAARGDNGAAYLEDFDVDVSAYDTVSIAAHGLQSELSFIKFMQ